MAEFWDLPTMNNVVSSALSWTTTVGAFLVLTFMVLKFALEYFKYSLSTINGNNPGTLWDWNEVFRVLILLLLLGAYVTLAEGFTGAIKSINEITQKSSEMNGKLGKLADDFYVKSMAAAHNEDYQKLMAYKAKLVEQGSAGNEKTIEAIDMVASNMAYKEYGDATNSTGQGHLDAMYNEDGDFQNPDESWGLAASLRRLLLWIVMLISWVIKIAIGTGIKIIFSIGIVLGPIVIAFSLFSKDKLPHYLNMMLTLGFAFTTINILDMLVAYYLDYTVTTTDTWSYSQTFTFALVMIGCYFMVYKITSWFVGTVGMGGIMAGGAMKLAALAAGGVIAASKARTMMMAANAAKSESDNAKPDA